VIFGFNTDVEHAGTVYHVQSEAHTHELLLQTEVFVKGRFLGKRATSYAGNLQEPGFCEERIHEMLKNQHRHLVAAAREGRIEAELAAMPDTMFSAPTFPASDVAAPEPDTFVPDADADTGADADLFPKISPAAEVAEEPAAASADEPDADIAPHEVSAWTLRPISAIIGNGISFDCLPPVSGPDGAAVTIAVQVTDDAGPAADAEVSCRITSAAGPATYVYAISGENGLADVPVSLDELDLASAALLIRVSRRGRSASRKYELRQR
jgi:hypothetical protein